MTSSCCKSARLHLPAAVSSEPSQILKRLAWCLSPACRKLLGKIYARVSCKSYEFSVAGRDADHIESYGLADRWAVGPLVCSFYDKPAYRPKSGRPVYVLGISGTWHDAAACLFRDGAPLAALEEERITREKHDPSVVPEFAIKKLLELYGLSVKDIDHVAIGWNFNLHVNTPHSEPLFRTRMREMDEAYARRTGESVDALITRGLADKNIRRYQPAVMRQFLLRLANEQGVAAADVPPISFVPHHRAHAASAYYASGFKAKTLVLVADGYGDDETTSVWVGENGNLTKITSQKLPDSLGWVWAACAEFTGFKPASQEGELMGFAAFGAPRNPEEQQRVAGIRAFFDRMVTPLPGGFRVDPAYIYYGHMRGRTRITQKFVDELSGLVALNKAGVRYLDPDTHRDLANFAYALQEKTNDLLLEFARYYLVDHPATRGLRYLAYAGGLALNIVATRRIAESGLVPFENIFIPPVPTDAGTALGAAYAIVRDRYGVDPRQEIPHGYFGPSYSDEEIQRTLESFGLVEGVDFERFESQEAIADFTAHALAKNEVVLWFQGGSEFGPRALLARSILFPLSDSLANHMANRVKERQAWRPSAMSILDEDAASFFKSPGKAYFMVQSMALHPDRQGRFKAGTHIDGTTRPQVVTRAANPLAWAMLKKLKQLTKVGAVVNTSFNRKEPIVESPEEALNTFHYMRRDANHLVIGSFHVRQRAVFRPSIISLADEPATAQLLSAAAGSRHIDAWDRVFEAAAELNDRNRFLRHTFTIEIFKPGLPVKMITLPVVKEFFEGARAGAIVQYFANRCYNESIQDGALHIHFSSSSHKMGPVIERAVRRELQGRSVFERFANFTEPVRFSYGPEERKLIFFAREEPTSSAFSIGVDVGVGHIKVIALCDGEVVHHILATTVQESGLALRKQILQLVADIITLAPGKTRRVASIGIALPGVVRLDEDGRGRIRWIPNLERHWDTQTGAGHYTALNGMVEELMTRYHTTRVNLINDVKAFGVNELMREPVRFQYRRVVVVALGTGMGTVDLHDGGVNFSTTHQAGDMILEFPSSRHDPSCGCTGCVAGFLSVVGLLNSVEVTVGLRGLGCMVKDFEGLQRLLDAGGPAADIVMNLAREGGSFFARWVQQLNKTMHLDAVIVTGGVAQSGFGTQVLEAAQLELQEMGLQHVSIDRSPELAGTYGGAMGAARFAHNFTPYETPAKPPHIAYSLLGAKRNALAYEVEDAMAAGFDAIHIDHLDGKFTNNPPVDAPTLVGRVARVANALPLQVHLMSVEPDSDLLGRLALAGLQAGRDTVIVHHEAFPRAEQLCACLTEIHRRRWKAAMAISPGTEIGRVCDIWHLLVNGVVRQVTLMSVPPGASRQKFLEQSPARLTELQAILAGVGRPVDIQLDGGMNSRRVRDAVRCGATMFVVRTFVRGISKKNLSRLRAISEAPVIYSLVDANKDAIPFEVKEAEAAGLDGVQINHIGGGFTGNEIQEAVEVVSAVRHATATFPIQVHIAVYEPEAALLEQLLAAGLKPGKDLVKVQLEAFTEAADLEAYLRAIKNRGLQAGIALRCDTPIPSLLNCASALSDGSVASVTVMSVRIGASEQEMIANSLERVRECVALLQQKGWNIPVELDGGIDDHLALQAIGAGASSFVVRTYLQGVSRANVNALKMRDGANGALSANIKPVAKSP